MQYLLTEAEYIGLKDRQQARLSTNEAELQALCTLAARHVPVLRRWAPERPAAPWGCILDAESNPVYCDLCPAQKLCPHKYKEWSK